MTAKTITIIDYEIGNLYSIKQAFSYLGCDVKVTSDSEDVKKAECVVLPGVGHFGKGMESLSTLKLIDPIQNYVQSGRPVLGVCLGMQLLMETSEECNGVSGLGILKGSVSRFDEWETRGKYRRIPHIGWNTISPAASGISWQGTILKDTLPGSYFYFAHSYFVIPENILSALAVSQHQSEIYCSVIKSDNIYGCQFHPEKSGRAGLSLLQHFINCS